MEMRKLLEQLDGLCAKSKGCELENGELIVLSFDSLAAIQPQLDASGLDYQERGSNSILINLSSYPGLFFDREHFKREAAFNPRLLHQQQDVGILRYTADTYLYYDCLNDSGQVGTQPPGDLFVQNTRWYYQFFDTVLHKTDIVAYHNESAREMFLMSTDKGRFVLGYPALAHEFRPGFSVEEQYRFLEKLPSAKDFQLHLEMQVVDVLQRYDPVDRFPKLIENIQNIKSRAENSYKLFLSKFDFEKFHTGFQQKRDAYFKGIRDIIDGLLSRVVAIPVSISAAALAIYNVREEPLFSTVVMFAFLVYSLFTSYLMRLSHISIFDIETALEEDILAIGDQTKIPREEFNPKEDKLHTKIRRLRFSVVVVQLLLSALSLAVVFIFAQQFPLEPLYSGLLMGAILTGQLLIAFLGVKRETRAQAAKK